MINMNPKLETIICETLNKKCFLEIKGCEHCSLCNWHSYNSSTKEWEEISLIEHIVKEHPSVITAIEKALEEGEGNGRTEGYNDGFDEGYAQGKKDGIEETKREYEENNRFTEYCNENDLKDEFKRGAEAELKRIIEMIKNIKSENIEFGNEHGCNAKYFNLINKKDILEKLKENQDKAVKTGSVESFAPRSKDLHGTQPSPAPENEAKP